MQIPKNIVQSGKVDANHKIYVEDYVYTFLSREIAAKKVSIFYLYGKTEREGELFYYFVYGALTEEEDLFGGREKIGILKISGDETWFCTKEGNKILVNGCFIFYEQNEEMQAYLIRRYETEEREKKTENRVSAGKITGIRENSYPERGRKEREKSSDAPEKKGKGIQEILAEADRKRRTQKRQSLKKNITASFESAKREKSVKKEKEKNRPAILFIGTATLLLCAFGVTAVNDYHPMRDAGQLFSQVFHTLKEDAGFVSETESRTENEHLETQTLVVEEKQAAETEQENGTEGEKAEEAMEEITEETEGEKAAEEKIEEKQESMEGEKEALSVNQEEGVEISETSGTEEERETEEQSVSEQETEAMENASRQALAQNSQNEEIKEAENLYTVKEGDNLALISRKFYGGTQKVREICELNHLDDPNKIIPGQKIILP